MKRFARPVCFGAAALIGLATVALAGSVATSAGAAAATAGPAIRAGFSALADSGPSTANPAIGRYRSSRMTVEVALAPRNQAGLDRALHLAYTPHSGSYHQWLAKGRFDARYAPTRVERAAIATYLRAAGLVVSGSASPFLIRATGSSRQVSAAFGTALRTYRDSSGTRYFTNSAAVQLPTALVPGVLGVIGLSDAIRAHSMIAPTPQTTASRGSATDQTCEAPFPSKQELFNSVNFGDPITVGFGAGPGCSGLTPAQTNSIYHAPHVGSRGKGGGVNLALFELSAYQRSDITHWARTFLGPHYRPRLTNVNVDGGPLHPRCPAGDTCPPTAGGYAGDIEVDGDIEMQLALAPDAHRILVYNAPNDFTGQATLDEYTAIARADQASVVSSSWAVCEDDESSAYVQAENEVFEQMALQGQSAFAAAGDTGAFSCLNSSGATIANLLDPGGQPWVTSVGGTSLESANPDHNAHPGYPQDAETVWNDDNLCNTRPDSAAEGDQDGLFWCAETGAGGGGSSQWWGRPSYQFGPGVNNSHTTYGNGSTHCAFAKQGTPCREDPDISANADEFTPYTEYCTGNANTPQSVCANIDKTVPGWFGVGGTSLSSPLWSAIIADRDSYQRHRSGNINPLLYRLNNADASRYFHDITGAGQQTTDNGLFPTTPGYDEATGLGTPNMTALITRRGRVRVV
jgi:subtilase family serine protease